MFAKLFSPLQVGKKLTLKNRIIMPPMGTNYASPEGRISERNILYYQTRAQGGLGLIIVEAAYIESDQRHRPKGIRISDDSYIAGLSELTGAIHACGVPIFQQVTHPGRVSSAQKSGVQPISASPVPHPITGEIPRPLTADEIIKIEELFAQTALRAKKAGFDGVEIHGGHGYLLASFLSPYTNKRTDEYGGSLDNRMRFPLETVARTRSLVGNDFLLSFRFSATEFIPDGFNLEEAREFAAALERAGVDLLHVSAGNNEQPRTMAKCIPLGYAPPGCFAHLAAAIKEVVRIPVIAVGRINSPEVAEKILEQGQADLVAVGRAMIADPYWPAKAKAGQVMDINKCIACNEGCIERLNRGESIGCSVNPWVGQKYEVESENCLIIPKERKTVIIVGGGPSGLKAAEEIAKRGHIVTLVEKEAALGGQVRLANIPPGKDQMIDLVRLLEYRLRKLNVKIELNKELTAANLAKVKPDAVVVATGSRPVLPPIRGFSSHYVVTADEVLGGSVKWTEGSHFVVVGGGMVGLETAHLLACNAKKVTVLEIAGIPGANCIPTVLTTLLDRLESEGVPILLNTQITNINDNHSVRILRKDLGRSETIENVDYVIIAAGRKSYQPLADLLAKNTFKTYFIGDCQSPRKIIDAISEGANVAATLDKE